MFKLCLHNNLNNKLYIYFFFFAWSAGENRSTDLRRADGWPLTQSRSHLWGNLLEMDCPFSSDLPGGWKIGSLSFGILRQDQNGWRRVSADIRCSIGEIWGSDQVCLKKKTDMWTWSDSPCERTLICCTAVSQVECVKSRQDSYCQTQAK